MKDNIESSNIPHITNDKLKTCVPYNIKYPIPFLQDRNSPMITPINDIDKLILRADIISFFDDGIINFINMSNLFAPKTLNSFIKSLSQDSIPFKIVINVTIILIKSELKIIDLVDVPNQIIIRGPNDTFGKLFNITINGSNMCFNVLKEYNKSAIKNDTIKEIIKDIITSMVVVYICINKLLFLYKFINVVNILDGEEKIKELIMLYFDNSSHITKVMMSNEI